MSTDIQQANGQSNRPKLSELKVKSGQGIAIETVADLHNFSVFAAAQGMVPSSFRDKKGQWNTQAITLALVKGFELRMKPTQALQSIYVVNGQPAIWGDALPALALASGNLEDFRERYEGEGDDLTAVCVVKRRGLKSEYEDRFSVADAKESGLWGKSGPWQQHGKRMLRMRARARVFRAVFADVLKGLDVVEEAQDIEVQTHSEEPEFESRQDEMLASLTDEVEGEWSEAPAEPDEEEAEAIRQADMAEAAQDGRLFNGGDEA